MTADSRRRAVRNNRSIHQRWSANSPSPSTKRPRVPTEPGLAQPPAYQNPALRTRASRASQETPARLEMGAGDAPVRRSRNLTLVGLPVRALLTGSWMSSQAPKYHRASSPQRPKSSSGDKPPKVVVKNAQASYPDLSNLRAKPRSLRESNGLLPWFVLSIAAAAGAVLSLSSPEPRNEPLELSLGAATSTLRSLQPVRSASSTALSSAMRERSDHSLSSSSQLPAFAPERSGSPDPLRSPAVTPGTVISTVGTLKTDNLSSSPQPETQKNGNSVNFHSQAEKAPPSGVRDGIIRDSPF